MTRAFRVVLIGLAAALALGVSQAQELSRYEQWQASRPFTVGAMSYDGAMGPAAAWPPPSEHPDMDLFQQAGLNLFDDVSHSNGGHNDYPGVATAQAAGVPFMIMGAGWAGKGAPTALESFQKHVRFFADDPVWSGFCGVQLADEPPESECQDYRQQRDWLVQTYPDILTMLCGPVTGLGGRHDWPRQVEAIQPDAFVYQFYPYHTMDGGKPDISPGVYACLGKASEFCKTRGMGFFIAREAYDWGDSVRRLNTFAALAYGTQGFIDWFYDIDPRCDVGTGYIWYDDDEEKPTSVFQIMAQINREVNNLGPALLKLRHIRTYHLDLESGGTWAGPIHNFDERDELRTGKLRAVGATTDFPDILGTGKWQADRSTDHLMVGFFRDENDEEYFMVVNKNNTGDPDLPLSIFFRRTDPEEHLLGEKVTLTFAPEVSGIQRLNRLTGKVEELSLKDHSFSFSLPGGTGDLFKYTSDAPFAGISQ